MINNESSETAAANDDVNFVNAKPECETVLSQEELEALAEKYTKEFGKADQRKDDAVTKILAQLGELSDNNAILGLDMIALALYTYLLRCARQSVGFYPKNVQEVLMMLHDSYKQDPDVVAFSKIAPTE